MTMRSKPVWVHPLLFAIYPVLALYSVNVGHLLLPVLIRPLLCYIGLAAVLYAFFYRCYHDHEKSALMVSAVFLVSLLFGHGFEVLDRTLVGKYLLDDYRWIWGPFVLWVLYTLFRFIRILRYPREVTRAVTVMASVMILLPLIQIVRYYQIDLRTSVHLPVEEPAPAASTSHPVQERPDIYYIILDGYTRQDVLTDLYGYDNSWFIDGLKRMGFVVLPRARTNYCFTSLSLASSLNMRYINELNKVPNQDEDSMQLIREDRVMKVVKSKGYKVIHFSSGWTVTGSDHPLADFNFSTRNLSQFSITLEQTSLLRFFVRHPFFVNSQREVLLYNLAKIKDIPKIPSPKFIFLHLVCPHPPWVFDREGRLPSYDKVMQKLQPNWLPKERYINQLHYLNGRVLEAVSAILQKSARPPIIIVQGDHGSATDKLGAIPTPESVYMRTSILNALYLPGNGRDHIPSGMTPVNTFRFIFNTYLGDQWPYLENKTYYSGPIGASPYTFIDVTDYPAYKP